MSDLMRCQACGSRESVDRSVYEEARARIAELTAERDRLRAEAREWVCAQLDSALQAAIDAQARIVELEAYASDIERRLGAANARSDDRVFALAALCKAIDAAERNRQNVGVTRPRYDEWERVLAARAAARKGEP